MKFDNEDLTGRLEKSHYFIIDPARKLKTYLKTTETSQSITSTLITYFFVTNETEMAFVTKLGETIKVTPRFRRKPKTLAKQGSLSNFISKIK